MTLLHVAPYYAPAWAYGGVVRAVTGLTRTQAAAGHEVWVLTTDALSPSARVAVHEETIAGVRVTRVRNASNALRGRLNLSTPLALARVARRLLREHAIDVVHCHELRTAENLRIAPLAARLDLPMVVSPHGTLTYHTGRRRAKRAWDWLFGRRLLPRFDQVLALTRAEAAEARALWATCGVPLRDDQISIVPNGVDPDEFARLPSGDGFRQRWELGDGPVVLFLGRLEERKGIPLLIRAFADALRHAPAARLLLAGPDEARSGPLRAVANECRVADRVTFTGWLAGDDRLAALAAADVFVLPATGEGFSLAALEAMACGLPVVLTPDCHFPEVADAGAGLVVPRDVVPLSAALRALLTDAERRASMGRRARDLVCRRYSWREIAAQLASVCEDVITRRNRR